MTSVFVKPDDPYESNLCPRLGMAGKGDIMLKEKNFFRLA